MIGFLLKPAIAKPTPSELLFSHLIIDGLVAGPTDDFVVFVDDDRPATSKGDDHEIELLGNIYNVCLPRQSDVVSLLRPCRPCYEMVHSFIGNL